LCNKNDWLSRIAIANYANVSYPVNYFVEWVVVPERTYYLPLLDRYFNYKSNDKEALLFYNLILCTHYGEKNEWNLFEARYNNIINLLVDSYSLNNILKMRWFGVQLYYNRLHKEIELQESLLKEIINSNFINHNDSGHRVSSIFMISNYLHIAEQYQTIIILFEEKANESSHILGYWAELNYNQLKVYYAYSLYKIGRKSEAKIIFGEIKENRFDLNFKKRLNVVYKSLAAILEL
jgi:hypothetical protein